jgi:hypothetical protein
MDVQMSECDHDWCGEGAYASCWKCKAVLPERPVESKSYRPYWLPIHGHWAYANPSEPTKYPDAFFELVPKDAYDKLKTLNERVRERAGRDIQDVNVKLEAALVLIDKQRQQIAEFEDEHYRRYQGSIRQRLRFAEENDRYRTALNNIERIQLSEAPESMTNIADRMRYLARIALKRVNREDKSSES